MKKFLFVSLFVIAASLVGLLLSRLMSDTGTATPPVTVNQVVPRGGLSPSITDPFKGRASSTVTLIFVGSFSCVSCKDASIIMDQLLALYPDSLKIVWKDLPESAGDSYRAALAARCAQQQGRFWQYHSLLMQNQDILTTRSLYSQWAKDLKMKVDTFNTCLDGEQTKKLVDANIGETLGAGITAVPYFQINDNEGVEGLHTIGYFRREIDAVLAHNNINP